MTTPSRPHCSATVFGRSKTATNGMPPKAASDRRASAPAFPRCSSGTSVTSTQREYFSREAKKCTIVLGPVLIADAHFAEVVLRELAGQSLEPHQRRHRAGPQRLRQGIQRALAAGVAGLPRAMQQLDRPQRRVLGQRLHHARRDTRRPSTGARPADGRAPRRYRPS